MKIKDILKDRKKKKTGNEKNKTIAGVLNAVVVPFVIKAILLFTTVSFFVTAIDFVIELVTANNTPTKIYEVLNIEESQDFSKLVEIKENSDGEYYFDFVEDIDEKLDKVIEYMNSKAGVHNIPKSKSFLKKLIKAELVTKFPDLGGEVPEGSDGFQGATKIRRVSPDKKIGSLENKGAGEITIVSEEEDGDDYEKSEYEDTVKTWKKGDTLITTKRSILYYQTESTINPGSDTGDWNPIYDASSSGDKKISTGTEVKYTGVYKNYTQPLTKETTTYVGVQVDDIDAYIKAQNLKKKEENSASINANITNVMSPNDEENVEDEKTAGDKNEKYVIAIAAGHNSTDNTGASGNGLKEEELTIKVAELVEEMFKEYSNIEVKQVGSTSENKGGVKLEDRKQKAKDANPNLCIQIHFNSGGGTGVETIYKPNDGISQQLAEILTKSISKSMGLNDRGAGTDIEKCSGRSLTIIENAATSGFPSIVTEGGFIDKDITKDNYSSMIEKYAKGIVNGVVEYLETDHKGYSSVDVTEETVTESIDSIVRNLKYIPKDEFDKIVKEGKEEALKYFTLDEENKVITATWKYEGSIEIMQNATMDLATTLQKYSVPFEYLFYYYIDTNEKAFSEGLADKILDTEIVMLLQDNVTTTRVIETDQETENSTLGENTKWTKNEKKSDKTTETCNTSINFTYINAWCVKASATKSYSTKDLEMGNADEKKIAVPGTVTENKSTSYTTLEYRRTETREIPGEYNSDGTPMTKKVNIYGRTKTDTHTITHEYNAVTLEYKESIKDFIKLYTDNEMQNYVRTFYLFTIIGNNEKTKNLLDLTKYLIYKATGTSYGVVEYDFSVYDLSSFSDISSSSGLETFKEYLHAWEGHTGISEDGTKYRVGDDGAGHPTVGYGIDIYNSGFLSRFKAAGYDVSIGSYIDKDFVDALEDEEIQNAIKTVESKTSGLNLTIYQKYALVSRIYNCGSSGAFTTRNGKTFVEAYKAYWNQDRDDEYKVAANDSMYNHQLYTQYMCKPNTSNGQYMKGLENRRKSEWLLFKTGYYDRINKWCSDSEGGTIVESAVKIHNYVRTNGYYYAQAGVTLPNTRTRTIDCSSYVTWVLVDAKVSGFTEGMSQWNSGTFASNPLGWQVVSVKDAKPGDIVVYDGHVEIVAENDSNNSKFRVYNCGSDSSIKASGGNSNLPESSNSGRTKQSAIKILRVPQ